MSPSRCSPRDLAACADKSQSGSVRDKRGLASCGAGVNKTNHRLVSELAQPRPLSTAGWIRAVHPKLSRVFADSTTSDGIA